MKSPVPSTRRRSGFLPFAMSILLLAGIGLPAAGRPDREGAAASSPRNHFLIRLRPARPGGAATEEEKNRITRHFDYLRELSAEGKVVAAGMATDVYEEIVVIQAPDRLEAERIMVSDPAVSGDVLLAELHPFTLVFPGAPK